MAKYTKLKEGDTFMLRWLDANKTYDANDGIIVHIMDTENFKVDMGQIWLPIEHLQKMLDMPKEATYVTYKKKISLVENYEDWVPRNVKYLIRVK